MYTQHLPTGEAIIPNIINNAAVALSNKHKFPIIQGTTGSTIHYAQSATVDIGVQAVESAAEAFKIWRKTPISTRQAILNKVAEILPGKIEELAKREIPETSCDPHWPTFECTYASKFVNTTATNLGSVMGSIPPAEVDGSLSLVFKEPVGVVLCIIPWNAPTILGFRGISAALAAGCTVVFKASELCPWTHQLILEVFTEAGLPAGCLNKIQCSREDGPAVTEAIISHPSLRKVEFIGSAAVGKIIGALAGKYLKPVLMELGDQSPVIVLEDADLEQAAKNIVQGTLAHHGQICFGTERIIVHASIASQFTTVLKSHFLTASPQAGHAITPQSAQRAHKLIDSALSSGATLLAGSNELSTPTSLSPTLLTNVPPSHPLATQESFAPTAFLTIIHSDEEAIVQANDTSYGLSASIFTRDVGRGLKMARELEFGQVQINNHTMAVNVAAPQTGVKGSGWGSNGAGWGIQEFLYDKHVSLAGVV